MQAWRVLPVMAFRQLGAGGCAGSLLAAALLLAAPLQDAALSAQAGTSGGPGARAQGKMVPGAPPLRGLVVCERSGAIHLARLGEKSTTVLAPAGAWPRFSPDGSLVAFLRGPEVVLLPVTGGVPRRLATATAPRALAFAPGGGSIFFTDGAAVRSVDPLSGATRLVLEEAGALELDAAPDGTIVFTTRELGGYAIRGYDPAARRGWRIAGGCAASLSPDGRTVTCNAGDHRSLTLLERGRGGRVAVLPAPPGLRLDNQSWSNHPDWVVSVAERTGAILAQQVSTGLAWEIVAGGCDRPDLFVLP